MLGWFPSISSTGRIASGDTRIAVDGVDIGPGTHAQWTADGVLYYKRQPDDQLMEWRSGAPVPVRSLKVVTFSAAQAGRWAAQLASPTRVLFDNGTEVVGWGSPALSTDPTVWAAIEQSTDRVVTQAGTPSRYASSGCRDPHFAGRALAWNVLAAGRWQIAGITRSGVEPQLLNVEPEEFQPVPLMAPTGALWLLSISHTRVLLRPWGSAEGYVVADAPNPLYPAAAFLDANTIRIAWNTDNGTLHTEDIDLRRPRTDLTRPSGDVPFTITPGGVVEDIWPWLTTGATAVSPDGQVAWIQKSTERPDWGEWWDLDGDLIGHLEDASTGKRLPNGDLDGYYFQGPRPWLPRRSVTGWALEVRPEIVWRHGQRGSFPYRVSVAVGHGIVEGRVVQVCQTYDPRRPDPNNVLRSTGYFERFYYGPSGWVLWEEWQDDAQGTPQRIRAASINRIPGPYVPPQRSQPYPPVFDEPSMNPPGVTIDHFDSTIRPNQPWRVEFHDRNNPEFSGVVELVNGSLHVSYTNPAGTDRSGTRRPISILP